jgi:ubiquinone/menaquinone biosynthesis C-methylase UbiE
MLKLKGKPGYFVLHKLTERIGPEKYNYTNNDPKICSKLEQFFGPSVLTRFRDRIVLDFGCGRGADAVAAALGGSKRVIGLDVNDTYLQEARDLAEKHGVSHICSFFHALSDRDAREALLEGCDYVYSIDSFEHFRDPEAMLAEMQRLLKPGASLLISFGPPWNHPYGAHQGYFSRVPWIHFLFPEDVILAVRKHYIQDEISRIDDTGAGLNRMTVKRFHALIRASGLEIVTCRAIPIKGLTPLAENHLTREYFTSLIQCELRKPL